MALNPEIYEYFKKKYILEQLAEGEQLPKPTESKDTELLKKVVRQTSDKQGIIQNIAGNFISDGVIFLLRKIVFRG